MHGGLGAGTHLEAMGVFEAHKARNHSHYAWLEAKSRKC